MPRRSKPLDWMPFKNTEKDLEGDWAIDGPMLRVRTKHGSKGAVLSSVSFAPTLALMLADELAKEVRPIP
jgi:hypothetical protein